VSASREFELGFKVGRGSLVFAQKALTDGLGKWSRILAYLDHLSSRAELELVSAINYILERDLELTPPLKASIAADFVRSSRKILVSDVELMLGGGGSGQEGRPVQAP